MMLKKPRLKRLFFILFQATVANAENSIIHLSLLLFNSFILLVFVFGEPKGFMASGQDDPRALPEQSEAKA